MENRPTIIMVLRSGGDFKFRDVELLSRHINGKWRSEVRPRVICLWDKVTEPENYGDIKVLPLTNNWPKWWARMILYGPEMEQYRPFLYIDLDTVVLRSLENIFAIIPHPSMYITLEDFYQKGKLATGLAWIPANSQKVRDVWNAWQKTGSGPSRMDYFLRKVVTPDAFWQQLTTSIWNSKPQPGTFLTEVLPTTDLVCFHGKPRIFDVAEASMSVSWVQNYVEQFFETTPARKKVTVIIPYKTDRGWLKNAIESVPKDVQLLVSQGEGNWPENFNKVLDQAEGDYIKFLHEDDMLTENCIKDSVEAIEKQGVDFIHGNAYEIYMNAGRQPGKYIPKILVPTLEDLLVKNVIHSATLMYKREVFEKVGSFDESLWTAEEYEFSLRCLTAGLKIGYCNSFLGWYRRHAKQKVRTVAVEDKNAERAMVRRKYTK